MAYLVKNETKRNASEYIQSRNYLYQTSTCIICGQVLKHHTWKICKSCADFLKQQTDKYKKENRKTQ